MEHAGTFFWDAGNIKWMIVESYEDDHYVYRAVNLNKGILSDAKGNSLLEVLREVEMIEETAFPMIQAIN